MINLQILILVLLSFFIESSLQAQNKSKEQLKKDLEACECFLNAMKRHSNARDKFWEIDGIYVDYGGPKPKPGDQPKQIWHRCGPAGPPQGLYTHQQVVNNIRRYTGECQDLRGQLHNAGGRNSAEGEVTSEADQRRADFQQTANNIRNYSQIRNEAIARHKAVSRDVAQFAQIASNGDPLSIMQQYRSNLENIENIGQNLKEDIFNSTVNNTVGLVGDYQSGNYEGVLYSGAGMLEAAFENAEARKEVERQKAELERQRIQSMREAARELIAANNQAAEKWWSSAAQASDEAQERYFKEKAYYHFGYSRYVSSNFNASHTNWASYPQKGPSKPNFGNYYADNAKYHHRAALRKMAAYREMSASNNHDQRYLDEWLQGALNQYSAALAVEPENSRYYREMAKAASNLNLPLALQSYSRAYQINPNEFSEDEKAHFEQLLRESKEKLLAALLADDPDVVRPYLYHGLYELVKVGGEPLWQATMRYPSPKVTDLIYTEELLTYPANKRKDLLQNATLIAAEQGNLTPLQYLANQGFDFDYRYRNVSPLAAAAQFSQLQAFQFLLFESNNRNRAQAPFAGTGLLATALAKRYPNEAAQQLCAIKQEQDWSNTVKTMLGEVREEPIYLQVLSMCERSHTAIKTDQDLQGLAKYQFEHNLRQGQGELAVAFLDAEILPQEYLEQMKSNITYHALRHDRSALLASLKERSLLANQDENGKPMAHHLTLYGDQIVQTGMHQNFDLNARDADSLALAHKLVFSNRSNLLPRLAQGGKLNLNLPGPYGWTALHYAVRENRIELAEKLLAAGADKTIEDEWGRTPYDLAKERGHMNLKRLLK